MIPIFHLMWVKLLKNFFFRLINKKLIDVYKYNIEKYGYSAMGLHWSSKSSQYSRFYFINYLMKKYIKEEDANIADLGCGFGDFYEYLKKNNENKYSYMGYDINPNMIEHCKKKFSSNLFQVADHPIKQCDFTIISGTYNYAIFNNIELWENYLIFNLKKCFNKSSKGVIFNLQKSFKAKIINNIYYAGNDSMLKTLKKNFNNVYSHFDKNTPKDIYFIILRS